MDNVHVLRIIVTPVETNGYSDRYSLMNEAIKHVALKIALDCIINITPIYDENELTLIVIHR